VRCAVSSSCIRARSGSLLDAVARLSGVVANEKPPMKSGCSCCRLRLERTPAALTGTARHDARWTNERSRTWRCSHAALESCVSLWSFGSRFASRGRLTRGSSYVQRHREAQRHDPGVARRGRSQFVACWAKPGATCVPTGFPYRSESWDGPAWCRCRSRPGRHAGRRPVRRPQRRGPRSAGREHRPSP